MSPAMTLYLAAIVLGIFGLMVLAAAHVTRSAWYLAVASISVVGAFMLLIAAFATTMGWLP